MSKIQHITHHLTVHILVLAVILSTIILGNVKPETATAETASATTAETTTTKTATTCADVEVIFIHGAASDVGDSKDVAAWKSAFKAQNFGDLKLSYYSLGEKSYNGARYNGADIGISSLAEVKNTAETFFSAGKSGEFRATVAAGITELSGRITTTLKACPNTKFVFGGYSEGAYLLHDFFKDHAASLGLTPENVVYIATFGDPKLYLPEGEGENPPACRNEAFSGYRVYAPNCRASSGILGAEKPDYFPESQIGNVGLWCTQKDVMCSGYFDIFNLAHILDDHLNYADQNPYPYTQAAILVRQRLAKLFPRKTTEPSETVHPAARDTAILIDTTGSMASTIGKYKAEALKIAKATTESGGRIALFEYRDGAADGKDYAPKELCDFSCTYDEFAAKISALAPAGGGDLPESALASSLGVMNKLSWQKGATKSIVLLTDATYHDADFDGTTLSDVVKRSLEIDPVNFYIVAPADILPNYTSLATLTSGNTFSLSSSDIKLSSDTLLNRPDLNFQFETYAARTGEVATFLLDTHAENVDHFEWDLDLDGVFEITTTTPVISTLYTTPVSGFIQARVVTTSGLSSSASAILNVKGDTEKEEIPELTNVVAKSSGKITYDKSESTKAVAIFVDDYATGLTSEDAFTITDLNPENRVVLVPISNTGFLGTPVEATIKNTPKAPNTGSPRA